MNKKVSKRKKIIYNDHHPDKEKFPDWTIPLRNWMHLFIRRCEQFGSTEANLSEILNLEEAVGEIINRMEREINFKESPIPPFQIDKG